MISVLAKMEDVHPFGASRHFSVGGAEIVASNFGPT